MRSPALLPEAGTYGVAILTVLALSAFSLASHLYSRWFAGTRIGFMPVYASVLVGIVGWGALVLEPRVWFGAGPQHWLIGIALGVPLGAVAGWCDRKIVRSFGRRRALRQEPRGADRVRWERQIEVEVRPVGGAAGVGSVEWRADPLAKVRRNLGAVVLEREVGLPTVVAVGALEEIVFRGILVHLCSLLGHPALVALALLGTVLVFSLSHIGFGWSHVFAKMPLGGLALAGALVSGTVVCAVSAHVLFNAAVALEGRRQQAATRRSLRTAAKGGSV